MEIYADNAATTKLSRKAAEEMRPYFEEIYGNPSSLYSFGQAARSAVEESRERIARCFGADAKEIYFTSGGSESDNQAILTAAYRGEAKGKKHIISTAFEHHAVLGTLKKLAAQGFDVTLLDVHENGIVSPEQVREAIREDTCLVTVMYANNEIGTVQPIAEIGAVCREAGVILHTDAVQAAGHIAINAAAQNIDMMSVSAHKFHGPKGCGALYVRKGILPLRIIEGGDQERGRRAGTENVPGIVGTAAALEEACGNIEVCTAKLSALRDKLISGLGTIPYSALNGDAHTRLPGNVNFCFEGIEGESLLLLLDDKGIYVSSGSACASGSLDPSHVLLAIGRPHEVAHGSLRITLGEDADEEQVDYIIRSVKDTVSYLRSMSPFWQDLVSGKRRHFFAE